MKKCRASSTTSAERCGEASIRPETSASRSSARSAKVTARSDRLMGPLDKLVRELVGELKLQVKKTVVIINMVPDKLDPLVADELKRLRLQADIIIPEDKNLYRYDLEQKPLMDMPDNSPAVQAVAKMMANL